MSKPEQQCEYLKKDIFENTRVSQNTDVEYYYNLNDRRGGYASRMDGIHLNLARSHNLSSRFNVLSHESRHVWQYDLVSALERGEIKDPKLKKFAEELKYAFEHRPKDYMEYGESYYNCLFEKDAYAWGDMYKKRFYSNEADLYHIFDLSKASYYLG